MCTCLCQVIFRSQRRISDTVELEWTSQDGSRELNSGPLKEQTVLLFLRVSTSPLLFLLGVYVCMWVNVCAYHSVHVEVRGELQSQVSSLPAFIPYLPRIKLRFSGLICKCFYQYQWPILLAPDQIILFWLTNRLMIIKGVRVQKVAFSCTIISMLQGSTGKS